MPPYRNQEKQVAGSVKLRVLRSENFAGNVAGSCGNFVGRFGKVVGIFRKFPQVGSTFFLWNVTYNINRTGMTLINLLKVRINVTFHRKKVLPRKSQILQLFVLLWVSWVQKISFSTLTFHKVY